MNYLKLPKENRKFLVKILEYPEIINQNVMLYKDNFTEEEMGELSDLLEFGGTLKITAENKSLVRLLILLATRDHYLQRVILAKEGKKAIFSGSPVSISDHDVLLKMYREFYGKDYSSNASCLVKLRSF